jgi:hypothetical protein
MTTFGSFRRTGTQPGGRQCYGRRSLAETAVGRYEGLIGVTAVRPRACHSAGGDRARSRDTQPHDPGRQTRFRPHRLISSRESEPTSISIRAPTPDSAARAVYGVERQVLFLKQSIYDAPGEGAKRASALQGEREAFTKR